MKKILYIIAVILLLTGCAKTDNTTKDSTKDEPSTTGNTVETASGADTVEIAEGFTYVHQGVTIPMNVDAASIVKQLGAPTDYFEAASCAFQGLDKIYYYNGFELGTYPNGEKDFVSYVNLLDDTVSTEKGIYLGSTLDELLAAYGKDYTQDGTSYVYKKGESKLTFIVEEKVITQITYAAIVEGLNN